MDRGESGFRRNCSLRILCGARCALPYPRRRTPDRRGSGYRILRGFDNQNPFGHREYFFMGSDSVNLTDIVINLNYDPEKVCRYMPEFTVDTEDGYELRSQSVTGLCPVRGWSGRSNTGPSRADS